MYFAKRGRDGAIRTSSRSNTFFSPFLVRRSIIKRTNASPEPPLSTYSRGRPIRVGASAVGALHPPKMLRHFPNEQVVDEELVERPSPRSQDRSFGTFSGHHSSRQTSSATGPPNAMPILSPLTSRSLFVKGGEIHAAILGGDVVRLQRLLKGEKGSTESIVVQDGYTPLMRALAFSDESASHKMVRILLDRGAGEKLAHADDEGNTAAHWAARGGVLEIVKELVAKALERGESDAVLAQNDVGDSPLHVASRYGNVLATGFLIKTEIEKRAGVRGLELRNVEGKTAYDVAAVDFLTPLATSASTFGASSSSQSRSKTTHEKRVEVYMRRLVDVPVTGNAPPSSSSSSPVDLDDSERARQGKRLAIHDLFCYASDFFKTLVLHHDDCLRHSPLIGDRFMRDADEAYYARKERGEPAVWGPRPPMPEPAVWEAPARMSAIMAYMSHVPKVRLRLSDSFQPATRLQLERAHEKKYVDFVYQLSDELNTLPANGEPVRTFNGQRIVPLTPKIQEKLLLLTKTDCKEAQECDTSFSEGSLAAGLRAAGAVVHAVDEVVLGRSRNAFCVVRPPGHHAGPNGLIDGSTSCGFCLFNNVAIAALHALEEHPTTIKRIAIVDFDVHHGNGTEAIVRKAHQDWLRTLPHAERASAVCKILFFSCHLYDVVESGAWAYQFYPASGFSSDLGNNLHNVPLQPLWRRKEHDMGSTRSAAGRDDVYREQFGRKRFRTVIESQLLPLLRAYSPDLILMSAGFDGAKLDVGNGRFLKQRLNGFNLTRNDFSWVTQKISDVADQVCGGRMVSVLEGGYGRSDDDPSEYRRLTGDDTFKPLNRSSLAKNCLAHFEGLKGTELPSVREEIFGRDCDTSDDEEVLFSIDPYRADDDSDSDVDDRRTVIDRRPNGKRQRRGTPSERREARLPTKMHDERAPPRAPDSESRHRSASEYLSLVKSTLQPADYAMFLTHLGTFKGGNLSADEMRSKVSHLLKGSPDLMAGFERFL